MRVSRLLTASLLMGFLTAGMPVFASDPEPHDNDETFAKLQTFAEAFAIIRQNYVEELDDKDLISDALNGALESLDPHSSYVPQQEFDERQKSSHREYGGLGIEVASENDLVLINYVIQDGPAGKAGLVRGDYISAVDGVDVKGKSLSEAVEGMRGLAGDPIDVTVISEGQEPREVTIIRAQVQGRVVRHREEDGIAYMYIESFNHPRLAADVEFAINDLKETMGDIPGLVIDVRGNPGGLVDQTVKVAGYFLDGGEVFSARGRTLANTQRYNAAPGELLPDVPIVVLANSNSASAAEILAGAIQDRGRGIIVGRRTFGKGSVQSVMGLSRSTGALRLTTQRYYTPSGKSIQGRGIMPDVLVAFRPDNGDTRKRFREESLPNALINPDETDYEEDKSTIDYPPEDWLQTRDYQLEKAIELVKSPSYGQKLSSLNALKD